MTHLFPRPVRAVDILLAEVVRKIQLSPTDYDLAVARYRTIAEWLEREGSPLRGLVRRLYPQGSMAMRATISSRLENDEFDIDIMAELDAVLHQCGPRFVLDVLFTAISGEPGSRYRGKVTRNTRCVTVNYENMHLDVTPAVLLTGAPLCSSRHQWLVPVPGLAVYHLLRWLSEGERPWASRKSSVRCGASGWSSPEW